MKKHIFLSGAVAAVALGAMNAPAQFNYQNGDMIAAFGNGGSTDVIIDLGSIAQFQTFNYATYSWDLSNVLTNNLGSVNGNVYWSVFGVNDTSISPSNGSVSQSDPNTVWVTLGRANPAVQTHAPQVGSSALQQLAVGDIETIASLTNPSQAGPGMIADYAPGIELVNTSLGGYSPMMTGAFSGNFQGDWSYNILNSGAGVSDLYQSDPTAVRAAYLGNFTLDSSGLLSFNEVPEPSAWTMLGSGFLALYAIRRRGNK